MDVSRAATRLRAPLTQEVTTKIAHVVLSLDQKLAGQETRNKLTDYWATHDIKKGDEYAILTNLIHQEWSGVSVNAHKDLKGLKTQNLRDHMSEAELIFTALAELSTRQIAETVNATGSDSLGGACPDASAARMLWVSSQ